MESAIVVFSMIYKLFLPHPGHAEIPLGYHQASLGTWRGPHAYASAEKAAKAMQQTYDTVPNPMQGRQGKALRDVMIALVKMGKISCGTIDSCEPIPKAESRR